MYGRSPMKYFWKANILSEMSDHYGLSIIHLIQFILFVELISTWIYVLTGTIVCNRQITLVVLMMIISNVKRYLMKSLMIYDPIITNDDVWSKKSSHPHQWEESSFKWSVKSMMNQVKEPEALRLWKRGSVKDCISRLVLCLSD